MTDVQIRLPELGTGTEAEQLRRMQSYLFSLAEQLQIAFDGLGREQETLLTESAKAAKNAVQDNFSSVKAMIVRSADLVEAFSEKLEQRLAGSYVAVSDFGTYRKETEQRISANSENTAQSFRSLQQLESRVEGLQTVLLEENAYIRTGLLGQEPDGAGVYGVEIGQEECRDGVVQFRRFARLTARRLSFYDENGSEVAWVSQHQLHITDAKLNALETDSAVIRQLRLGEYLLRSERDGHLTLR